ncbi:ABC transporter substrate-binding protein [Pseudovibrio sp. SPO723]|uniref:ABC transporter substrate-binding protein n=1 Tax=Nesiotobacter zosterae TaxID=392721 RepID=UPI0029C5CFB6|nr:ABC transporter substrate-binding protein [Pseudovibrio sp. SPO723]MDX5594938.1 ABC transporter substrate-binding protein [Pseudovibrio sp. SPO723]
MSKVNAVFAALVLALPFSAGSGVAAERTCEVERPVVFAGLDWDSNAFHNSVAGYIIEHGYGCETDIIPGSSIPLVNGMARGDVDITMEIWPKNVSEALTKGQERGDFVDLGINFPDAKQAWYVPKYMVEGDDAPAKGLKTVFDLPKYKHLFEDPEEPGKGRFYNCIAGWACEVYNTKKLNAYQLNDHFVNFRPGTGAALAAAIESNIKRERPIVFFYWGPTWVMGKIGDQVVELEEPAFDEAIWQAVTDENDPTKVTEATAYPLNPAHVYVNTEFSKEAPDLVEFLTAYETSSAIVSGALAYMQDTGGTTDDAAIEFLKQNRGLWTAWVPEDVAANVDAALKQ